jgi:hypothetical protein
VTTPVVDDHGEALGADAHAALGPVHSSPALRTNSALPSEQTDAARRSGRLRPGAQDEGVVGGEQDDLVDALSPECCRDFQEARQVIAVASRA